MAVGRYAVVNDATGHVVNVILWDPADQQGVAAPEGHSFVEDTETKVGPGWTYENGAFVAPPSLVTHAQE